MSFLLTNMLSTAFSAATVLMVLKTIGMIALIVLCIVVIFAICVLFLPLRYQAKGDIDEMNYHVRLHWLFKIIGFRLIYKDGSVDYALYLFGIRTKFLDKEFIEKWKRRSEKWKARRAKRKAKKADRVYKSRKKKYQKQHDKYKEQYLKEHSMNENVALSDEPVGNNFESEASQSDMEFQSSPDETSTVRASKKLLDILKKILHIIQVIRDYQPLQLIWPDVVKFLHHARPRQIKADIVYGFDDPATTGQLLGVISNLYFIYQYDELLIQGDFETSESYITGDFNIKGYVQMVFVLILVLRVIKKKRFRKFLKALKL